MMLTTGRQHCFVAPAGLSVRRLARGCSGINLPLPCTRPRPDQHSGGDPRQPPRAVRPPHREEGPGGRPQQQPRGQEPSRASRDGDRPVPPPPPHRDREHRNPPQVGCAGGGAEERAAVTSRLSATKLAKFRLKQKQQQKQQQGTLPRQPEVPPSS